MTSPFWRPGRPRAEPEPASRPRQLNAADLRWPPTFEAFETLAGNEDVERLATLLTALAIATREGRTLYLIEEPSRLAERIALLTLALPPPWRADLTFSTYHDRPEELVGFRIRGRSRRSAEPAGPVGPRDRRRSRGGIDRAAHRADSLGANPLGMDCPSFRVRSRGLGSRRRRAGRVRRPEHPESIWDDAWLDRLFRLPDLLRGDCPPPEEPKDWLDLAEMSTWVGRLGLAGDWVKARDSSWWRESFCRGR